MYVCNLSACCSRCVDVIHLFSQAIDFPTLGLFTINNCSLCLSNIQVDRSLYLFVTQSGDGVDVLLLDHEGSQVGRVGSQEDDGKESPDQDHDLTRGALRVLNRNRVVKDDTPQQPDGFSNGEGGTSGI